MRGPTGEIVYQGQGNFLVSGQQHHFNRVSLVLAGSGVTPGYALLVRIALTPEDLTVARVIDANATEEDILLCEELDTLVRASGRKIEITHVLSRPSVGWDGERGMLMRRCCAGCFSLRVGKALCCCAGLRAWLR